jgi:glycogen operon protein
MAAAHGAATVGINPLHALFPEQRKRASPYYPSDRRFLDPIYLDLAALAHLPGGEALQPMLADPRLEPLRAAPLVDYEGVWSFKRQALEALWEGFAEDPGRLAGQLDAFARSGGTDLERFAAFCALSHRHQGQPWQAWPSELRHPANEDVRRFAAEHADQVRYQVFLQWLCDRQLAGAAQAAGESGMAIGLYRDLAVGGAPDGGEAWAQQDLLASGVSIGAPPDPLGPAGQVWGLPPPDPHAMAADGFRSFGALLRANMTHAGALRIDHAMGLQRLFWVPEGAPGSEGAYVAYPFEQLLAEVTLASQASQTLVIGEDLGTVPHGFREALTEADVLGYRVMLLEREGAAFRSPADYPPLSLACASSHDMPTLAGWWNGADFTERAALGQLSAGEAEQAGHRRQTEKVELAKLAGGDKALAEAESLPAAVLEGVHEALGSGSSLLVLAQLDDLAGEEHAINLPGTDTERANWRRKIERPLDDLFSGQEPAKILKTQQGQRSSTS